MMTCQECDGSGVVSESGCLGDKCLNEQDCANCEYRVEFSTCKICEGDGEVSDEYAEELNDCKKYDERRADR